MDREEPNRTTPPRDPGANTPADSLQPWQEPRLTFVEPKLTKQGDFVEITGQFFGAFSP